MYVLCHIYQGKEKHGVAFLCFERLWFILAYHKVCMLTLLFGDSQHDFRPDQYIAILAAVRHIPPPECVRHKVRDRSSVVRDLFFILSFRE
jgi:hypothetical protein